MEMKTRILLLGILSILYGLFVTDRKYPRTDKYGRISLNIHTAGTVKTEHELAGGAPARFATQRRHKKQRISHLLFWRKPVGFRSPHEFVRGHIGLKFFTSCPKNSRENSLKKTEIRDLL